MARAQVHRLIVYEGPVEWINLVISQSAIPMQGSVSYECPGGPAKISSGLVQWNETELIGDAKMAAAEAAEISRAINAGDASPAQVAAAVDGAAGQTIELSDGKGGKKVITIAPPSGKVS